MTLMTRLCAMPQFRAGQRPTPPSRTASPGRDRATRIMAWAAAASLAALVAGRAFVQLSPDLPAFGCWSIPDDASACALGQVQVPTLKDQLVKLVASVLPEHDGRAALAQQDLEPR